MWRFEASPRRAAPKGLPSSFAQHRTPKGTHLHPAPLFLRSWHTDITYIPTWEGWVYLATVIDCCTKEVIGWAMADNMKTPLVTAAIDMAAVNITFADGVVFHSDRGSQYTSAEFAAHLAGHGITQSLGRTGICYDNAMAESFFGALKNEWLHRMVFSTRAKARKEVVKYIEGFYNRRRLHSAIGYRTPYEARIAYLNEQKAA